VGLQSIFHQVEDDLAAGKRSPIVRLGTGRGAQMVPWVCGMGLAIAALAQLLGFFPLSTSLIFASALPAWRLSQHVNRYHNQPQKISNAKFYAIGFHFWSGLLLSLGFWMSTWGVWAWS
ncbi:MAG TPA: 2-carboxy-1,4-naphthoquinone phytyltransferase, partial [Leptolyngbyaceae cyanobacterium M65_K2018_010]|nr:2-carboxy-1,4-naphthoquinone phytyltransferase [Leptolyngbyaceae cyanobacterium M65_K2018_010]